MKKRKSFLYQTRILTDRYSHIFINDKQNLILVMLIPLLTVLIVCMVAAPDMYTVVPNKQHGINNGYPVLMWEDVRQEKEKDGTIEEVEHEKDETKTWNGKTGGKAELRTYTKIDDENYFMITDASQLAYLSSAVKDGDKKYLTYNYALQVNIDLDDREWTPIGDEDHPFTGTFDGQGHTIKNLKVDSSKDNVGLFGAVKSDAGADSDVTVTFSQPAPTAADPSHEKTEDKDMTFYHNGIVKNLKIESGNVETSGKNAGVLAGKVSDKSRINNISIRGGEVSADEGNAGAVAGQVDGSSAEVYLCYSVNTNVDSKENNVGGLVGELGYSKLSASYSTAKIGSPSSNSHNAAVGHCSSPDNVVNVFYLDKNGLDDKTANKQSESQLINASSMMKLTSKVKTAYEIENNKKIDNEDDDVFGFKKDDQLSEFSGTQTGLFMLVCVAIFVGICNSIQEICKERNILKREYMTNLRLSSYVVSKLIVQAILCAIQMGLVILIFYLFVMNKKLPDNGAVFGNIWLEYFITMLLLCFASDTMALFISSIVKNSATANTFIPIILIVQIVFSGVLFEITGFMDNVSYIMVSKWGIAALAATSHINDAQQKFLIEHPKFQLQLGNDMSVVKDIYNSTTDNIILIWGIILLFALLFSVACGIMLTRVKNDKR